MSKFYDELSRWRYRDMIESINDRISGKKENPILKAIIGVDHKGSWFLIEDISQEIEDVQDYIDGWCDMHNPGVYELSYKIHVWQDNTPDSCDWDSDLKVIELIPLKYEKTS